MKKSAAKKSSPKNQHTSVHQDLFLDCLAYLCGHYGRPKSEDSLKAGLAYDEAGMGPELFCEAAKNAGIKAQIAKKEDFYTIDKATLPAILILKKKRVCILLELLGEKAKIYNPDIGKVEEVAFKGLQTESAGYVIYVQPEASFNDPHLAQQLKESSHWFWSIVEKNKQTYGLVLLAAIFVNLFALTSPLFIMNVYDRVIPNNAIETGWALGIGALVVYVFDLIIRTLRGYLIDIAGRRIDVMAAKDIYAQVLNMRLSGRPGSSGAFANMLRDFDSVRDFFTSASITGFVDLPFTLLFLFVISQLAGGLSIIILGLLIATFVIGYFLQFPLKAVVRASVKSAEAKHAVLVETIHGLETLKSIGADGRFRSKYGALVAENAQYSQKSRFLSGLSTNSATFFQQIATILIVLAGMYMVADASLTMGGLIAAVILGGRAIAPIGQVANLMTRYHQAGGALKTLDEIMRQPVERPAGQQFLNRPKLKGDVAFDRVDFTYPKTERKILDQVSFKVNAAEKVGVIGRIGSGKSTIARLMMGLYEPQEGVILADNTDYRQIDPADLRRNIAYISQDVFLFSGTVRDNIAASVNGISDEDILRAAKCAGVDDFISKHPMGYDAPVGENGQGLSGGQRQAIALARAILLKPSIMVCDEPTNAMDMQAEAKFLEYVGNELQDTTLILVTHKPVLLKVVNRLILVENGKVCLDGPRDEVLEAIQSSQSKVEA